MPTVEFFHKVPPAVNLTSGLATVSIYAEQTAPDSVVILDDQDGDTHDVPADVNAQGASAQALAGTVAFIVDIAGRRGLSIAPSDVSEIEA